MAQKKGIGRASYVGRATERGLSVVVHKNDPACLFKSIRGKKNYRKEMKKHREMVMGGKGSPFEQGANFSEQGANSSSLEQDHFANCVVGETKPLRRRVGGTFSS